MARRPKPSITRPTLEYFAYRGPYRVAIGDLAPAGIPGLVVTPTSGRNLPVVALAHGWMQPVHRYADTMRYLASWGIIVAAPNTHKLPLSSHQLLAYDLSRVLRILAAGNLGGGRVRGDARRMGVIGHSIGGGAAVLAAAHDDSIRAVVTVTAAQTQPSAVEAAAHVRAPSLHLIGRQDNIAHTAGGRIAQAWGGPTLLRSVGASGHLGLTEGRHWTNPVMGVDSDEPVQRITRVLASAFFIRHLTDAPQLADQLENSIRGTAVLDPAVPPQTLAQQGAAAFEPLTLPEALQPPEALPAVGGAAPARITALTARPPAGTAAAAAQPVGRTPTGQPVGPTRRKPAVPTW